jgi:hypothetical protein
VHTSKGDVTNVGLKSDRAPSFVWGVPRADNVIADNEVALRST